MAYEINKILYVGKGGLPESLKDLSAAETYQIECVNDAGKAMEIFSQARCNLIILNDNLFGEEIFGFVRELKRRNLLAPVLVLSDGVNTTYQTNLMMAGADDFVPSTARKEELYYRVGFRLKQYRQSRELAQRNRNMYEITTLARRLHSNVDPETLIAETIDLTSSAFKLYGTVIVLMEDDMLVIYAGSEGVAKQGNLYESKMYPQTYEPFYRVIESGVAEVFDDITLNPHFVPIPTMPDVESCIIVPLRYQDYNIGAIAAFGTKEHPLRLDDLALYEILTSQFSVALQNAYYNHNQQLNMQFSRTLRRAWQRFVTLQSPGDIAVEMHQMIEELPGVHQGLVWLHDQDYWWMGNPVISSQTPETAQIMDDLIRRGHIYDLIERMDDGPQVLSQLGLGQKDPFFPLFKSLRSHQLVILPISDSTRLIGGVIASVANNREFSMDVVNLMKSLTHAAGQALERMTLIFATLEKSSRLEAILLSISEGIFFVDDNQEIAFCNPQFTELTHINPGAVLQQKPQALLENLASQSENYEETRQQLQDAIDSMENADNSNMDYPIVDVHLKDTDQKIYIEFISINNLNSQDKGWIGIVRSHSQAIQTSIMPSKEFQAGEACEYDVPSPNGGSSGVKAPATVSKSVTNGQSTVQQSSTPAKAQPSGAPTRTPQTIMVVKGNNTLTNELEEWLGSQGYEILPYDSGEDAIRDINLTRLDMIVIDMEPPDMKGLKVCKYMRNHTETPILMVSDQVSAAQKVKALNTGADDCVSRPITHDELMARVTSIFRRQQIPDRTREPLQMDDLLIDFGRREVFVKDQPVELTRIEYDLLHSLVTHQGQVLTHQQILEKVWGPEYRSETQYLWVNICRLRKKLEPTAYIQNRQGVGYVFQPQ